MGYKTAIQWTDSTWNVVTGCAPVSDGCKNCYAARYARRGIGDFKRTDMEDYEEYLNPGRKFREVRCHTDRLDIPLRWSTPRRIFVCSMGDLFHEAVPTEFILKVFEVMAWAKQHTFLVLTKRQDRMLHLFKYGDVLKCDSAEHHRLLCMMPQPNIWLGVTAENQQMADERIPLLLKTPSRKRFVSVEPCLGKIDLDKYLGCGHEGGWEHCPEYAAGKPCIGIDWVICGGESGPGARPCDIDWIRSLIAQCKHAGVACFVKQIGSNPTLHGFVGMPISDSKGANPDDWPDGLNVREFPHE